MFSTVRLVIILIMFLLIGGALWYVTSMREQLAISQENSKKLLDAVEVQKDVIEQIKKDVGMIQEANQHFATTIQSQNKDLNSLRNRFSTNVDGSSRDIGKIAIANPASVERAINRGTVNAIRCLEVASGAPLRSEEINAKTASEINKECPSLANPNYVATK